MPSPKSKLSSKQSNKITIVIISAIFAAIVLAIAGYIGYNSYLDYQDKQRFETVRASVKILRERLQTAAGPGTEWTMREFCREGSVKFQEALKSCDIVASTEVAVGSTMQGVQIMAKYKTVFGGASNLFTFQRNYNQDPPTFKRVLSEGIDGAVYREKNKHQVRRLLYNRESN